MRSKFKLVPECIGRPVVCCALLFGFSACASFESKSPEEIVTERVLAQAEAFMALDYDLALTFMTPTYQKSPRASRFRAEFSGASWWQGVDMKWVNCEEAAEPSRCDVRVIIHMMRPPAVNTPIPIPYDMVWANIDGVWYRLRS